MKIQNIFKIFILAFCLAYSSQLFAQQTDKKVPTRDEIMEMTYEQLLNLPFEELINLASIMGVSADELLQMILNKDVSSASKSKEKVFQSPLSTTVISKEELIKSGARSIPEALRLVPGMIVREKTTGNYDMHIRGNDNVPPKNMFVYSEDAMSLVMIDNRPVYNYSFGGTFWESLPIDINDVERIEVIRGPSSALYGPNAVAGVINIITKTPESNKLSAHGNVQVGTQNTKIANLGLSGGVGDKFKFRVSGNYLTAERFDDKFYVFDLNKSFTYDEMDTLTTYWDPMPSRKKQPAEGDFKDQIISKKHSASNYGANAFLFYDLNKDVHFNLSTGVQESDIVLTSLGNHQMPYAGRKSNTQYVDFKTKAYGFDFQTNYMWGNQQVERGKPAWHISPKILNTQLEYEYKLNKLTLRPGISYSNTVYSDKDYVDIAKNEGFLNGDKLLTGMAGFIRADYKPFEKLRLIAALRADKYNLPNKTYFTYQFISTFNITDNNIVRAVYSRANRGPFIVDTHADYHWNIIEPNTVPGGPSSYTLIWNGNQNLKLPTADMIELGYRTKLGKHIIVDIEAFRTETKDYSYFVPDSMSFNADWTYVFMGLSKSPSLGDITGTISYHNFDMTTVQQGITTNISVALNKELNFRLFGTLQETKINNFYNRTIWQDFSTMISKPLAADGAAITPTVTINGNVVPNPYFNATRFGEINANKNQQYSSKTDFASADTIDTYNKSTPTFYGGLSIDYMPTDKLSIFATAYFYSSQTIMMNKVDVADALGASDMYKVKAKMIPTIKISYKVWKENSVYVNARNFIPSNDSKEFAYTDRIGATYLVGVNFSF